MTVKKTGDNWEKRESGGRFLRDVVIVAVICAGGFGFYWHRTQNSTAANKTAKVAKDLLLKDTPATYAQAEAKLKEVIEKYDSSHGYSLAALAELNAIMYAEQKVADRKNAAVDFSNKAVAEHTGIAEEYSAKALLMVADGKAAEAEAWLTKDVIEKGGGGARILAALGQAFRAQGKLDDARRAFKGAFDADWRNPRFAELIGESYLEDGDAANALVYFSKGLNANSEHLGNQIGAARAMILRGQGLEEAAKKISDVLANAELTPRLKAEALVAKAEHEIFEQKFDDAIASASAASQADATFAWSHAVKAMAEARKGDANAVADFDKAIAADPYVAAFYFNAAEALLASGGDQSKAVAYLDGFKLKKDDRYWVKYGDVLMKIGKMDDALAKYDEAIKENEFNGQAYLKKGSILRQQGKTAEAEEIYAKALVATQDFFPEIYVEKAMLRFDKKEYEQGMQEYATALTQWRTAKQPREKLTEAIASVKGMLEKAGQKQYAKVWEDEATQLIR